MRRLVATAVVVASAALPLHPSSATAVVPPPGVLVTAASFGLHDSAQNATASYGAIRLWDTGTTWAQLEPAPGTYDWARLDAYVANAGARRTKVTLVLGSTPTWAATDPTADSAGWLGLGNSSPPRSESDWVRYVGAVATRYRGRIDSYQVWNEASLLTFWKGTPDQMARLTQLASFRVHAVDPAAKVVSTPMLPRQTAWTAWSTAYLQALRARGWPVDVFAVHSYQPDALAYPDGRFVTLRRSRALLAAVRAPARPLWDTEANYSNAAFHLRKIGGQQAADWTARAYLDSLRMGVSRTYWYAWNNPVGHLGVTMSAGSPSQRAFSVLQSWIVGSTFQGCAVTKAPTRVVVTSCAFRRGARTAWVVWGSANARTALPVRARSICRLLTGCRVANRFTFVTTSPVLLR